MSPADPSHDSYCCAMLPRSTAGGGSGAWRLLQRTLSRVAECPLSTQNGHSPSRRERLSKLIDEWPEHGLIRFNGEGEAMPRSVFDNFARDDHTSEPFLLKTEVIVLPLFF